jgi:AmmeMemoRadiSam system protein A
VLTATHLEGDLGSFRCPQVKMSYPNDLDLLAEIENGARGQGISLLGISTDLARRHCLNERLDHGILVPLYYLQKAGLSGQRIIALSVGYLDNLELYSFGRVIKEAAAKLGRKLAIVASGDMSHRLKDEGPYDYHPDGSRFDHMMKDMLESKDVKGLLNISHSLRQNAGECGYMSAVIMLGTMDGQDFASRVFSYEGPFGVGYLVAGLQPGEPKESLWQEMEQERRQAMESRRAQESPLVKWARRNLESKIRKEKAPQLTAEMEYLRQERAGAFVSIKKHGHLRGCIGTFQPAYANLAEEIAQNALAAGLHDPRFAPVEAGELDSLDYSVDILAPPQPCTREELDPQKYGVIVSSGGKRGLLLPDLEGVDTVEQQLQIALQKAGISNRETYTIQRFEVKRYK